MLLHIIIKSGDFVCPITNIKNLRKVIYEVFIDSSFKKGYLNIGEIILKGKSKEEVFLSTYICHPSMANNELSGPVVLNQIIKWLKSIKRKYTYRIVFLPETIGSITYLSKKYKTLKNVIAGYNLSCLGDEKIIPLCPPETVKL